MNDALLASAAGYTAALSAAGERLPTELPVSIPVALRRRGTSGNQVGVMLVRLPLAVPESDTRLRLIASRTRVEKERAREQGTLEFMRGPRVARMMDFVAHRQHVVAVSYAGRLRCSIHFDKATVPGTAFAQAMSEELTRLAGSSR